MRALGHGGDPCLQIALRYTVRDGVWLDSHDFLAMSASTNIVDRPWPNQLPDNEVMRESQAFETSSEFSLNCR